MHNPTCTAMKETATRTYRAFYAIDYARRMGKRVNANAYADRMRASDTAARMHYQRCYRRSFVSPVREI